METSQPGHSSSKSIYSSEVISSSVHPSTECNSDINRNIETKLVQTAVPADNSCVDCNLKFDTSTSLEVHLQYHNKNLYTKWSVSTESVAPPPPPAPAPALTTVTASVQSRLESPSVVASSGQQSLPPDCPASSMQISMAQSMGIQQGAPPHLHSTAHQIFNSSDAGQSQTRSPNNTPGSGLPSINTDVSEFFSQLETVSTSDTIGVSGNQNMTLDTFHANTNGTVGAVVTENKNNSARFHPYGGGGRMSSVSVSQYQSYNSPFHGDTGGYGGSQADYLQFSDAAVTHPHDQSSEEIWDLDSHTVRRYNPGPDPVSPGPIPTTPTMYGVQTPTGGQNKYDNSNNSTTTNLYSPYGAINRGQTPLPPQSLSPGLSVSGWLGPAQGIKGGGGGGQVGPPVPADAKRPKSYQCEACDKWFTSSGHLKRHFNTTLHKNAMKQKGDAGYIDNINGGSFSIPSVESRGAPSPCMSLGEESSQSSICEDNGLLVPPPLCPTPVSASTSLPDTANCSPVSSNTTNTSPNVPTLHHSPPDNNLLQGTRTVPDSPLSGLSQLACTTPQSPSTPGLLNSSSPNSNLNASPASHKNRFSPFRTGVGPVSAPANNNPSYKVQNIDPRQHQQQQSYHPSCSSYPTTNNTFQSPSIVSSHNFNGDIYNLQQQSLVSSSYRDQYHHHHHHHQPQQQQYSGQYHTQQYQPLVYSSTYDMSQPNYMSHNSFNDISAYTPMPQDGLNSIFPEHVNNRTIVKKERNSPEGSEGSDSLNEVGEHRCNECNKVFNKICYLKQHNKSFHQGEKPFKCTQCGKRFPAEVLYQVVIIIIFAIINIIIPSFCHNHAPPINHPLAALHSRRDRKFWHPTPSGVILWSPSFLLHNITSIEAKVENLSK